MEHQVIGAGTASYPAGVTVAVRLYTDMHVAVHLNAADDGLRYASLSTNIRHAPIADDEFAVSSGLVPEDVCQALLDTGAFADTGRVIHSGHATFPIWRITDQQLVGQVVSMRVDAAGSAKKRRKSH
ncbi:hypothetical protein Q3O97_05805 [Ralstonia pseudosolanacearum]|uniref:hypothetical protein n=1 Tax=Ralstonia pseudosolanacearum TaxID=1310165 RepID=UPI00270EA5E1|nr:hypothetical protein [Ralstonia pseudosolanacearum]MDO3615353.1 hypothetical protein [Ralstonia pseudosolanacearum]